MLPPGKSSSSFAPWMVLSVACVTTHLPCHISRRISSRGFPVWLRSTYLSEKRYFSTYAAYEKYEPKNLTDVDVAMYVCMYLYIHIRWMEKRYATQKKQLPTLLEFTMFFTDLRGVVAHYYVSNPNPGGACAHRHAQLL